MLTSFDFRKKRTVLQRYTFSKKVTATSHIKLTKHVKNGQLQQLKYRDIEHLPKRQQNGKETTIQHVQAKTSDKGR